MPKDSENMAVRKAQPESGQEDITGQIETPEQVEENIDDLPENNSLIAKAVRGVSSGVSTAVTNWFGLKPVMNMVSSGISGLSSMLGVSKTVASVGLAAVIGLCGVGAGVGLVNFGRMNLLIRQEDYEDSCADDYDAAKNAPGVTQAVADVSAEQMEVAEKIWAWCQSLGMNDYASAGVIGNIVQESQLDPTEIESIDQAAGRYTLNYDKKLNIFPGGDDDPNRIDLDEMDSWVQNHIRPSNITGYTASANNKRYAGIGLIQWTGGNAYNFLACADSLSANGEYVAWTDVAFQLSYMMSDSFWSSCLDKMLADSTLGTSIEASTACWLGYVERSSGSPSYSDKFQYSQRLGYAKEWYSRLSSRSAEICAKWSDFVNSVIAMADASVGSANSKHAVEVAEACLDPAEMEDVNNGSLAEAAVAYAWETSAQSKKNNGTELYRYLHDNLFSDGPGWPYMSCDASVATAVRWSGADPAMPIGGTSLQDSYLADSELWEYVGCMNRGASDEVFEEDLQPGDILITIGARRNAEHGHIVMYVGNDTIREKYPDSICTVVSGSLNDRSPACVNEGGCKSAYDHEGYWVYRYVGDYSGDGKDIDVSGLSGTS